MVCFTIHLIDRVVCSVASKCNLKKIILMIAMLAWMSHSMGATAKHSAISIKQGTHRATNKIKHNSHQKRTFHTTTVSGKHKTSQRKSSQSTSKKIKKTYHHPRRRASSILASSQRAIVNTNNVTRSNLPAYLLTSIEKNLVNFVRQTIATIRYTAYKLGGTHIDTSRGIYVVDCSSYVDHILKTVYPDAYTSLTSWSGSEKPTTHDYYHYFVNLSAKARHWNTIEDVEQLRPGDILVFRYKNQSGNETGGHVMIVMDKPMREGNTFMIRIADSAPAGHSLDTRLPHASGIGIGTILLKVDTETFQPYAYAWKVGSRWENNVNFAMARPIDMS